MEGDIHRFHQQLCKYEDSALRMIYEYFRDDLIYTVEALKTQSLLSELKSRTRLRLEHYLLMKEDIGAFAFSVNLVEDILREGREAVIGFWESLYALRTDCSDPNLLAVLNEITQTGDTLVNQIMLDEHGHNLNPELKDIHKCHKQHLLEETQSLVEHIAPGSKQEEQSFYISERFVNLVVVSNNQVRQHSQNELIKTGIKHEKYMYKTKTVMEHIVPNRLFRWCYRSGSVPHTVMVRGVPGVGKTTLMQKFVYDWVTGKLYQRFAFVFFFKFRELNRLDKVSLEDIILQQYPYLRNQLGNILQDPEKLIFIFDGLDESTHQMDFRSSRLCCNIKQLENIGVIVVSLVKEFLLKGCSVLITSRPAKLVSTDIGVFRRVSEIMGFFPREREMYFERFFQNTELSEKAFHYVRENDTLYTFCYIPSYCWIICTVLSMCFKSQPTNNDQLMSSLPKTVTQLFVTFVANILANHTQNVKDFSKVLTSMGWMAEHGVMNHIIIFDERELGLFNVDVSSHLLSSFMMESNQPPNVTYSFLHLTIQEFLAALVHYLDYSPEKLQRSLNEAKSYEDNRCEIFLRFLCGLSDISSWSILKPYLGDLSIQTPNIVISWLQQSILEVWKVNEYKDDKRQLLNVFVYLFETRNKALVLESVGSCKRFDFSYVPLSPLDCSVFPFILESCRETERLNLESCNIQSEGLERLTPALHTIKDLSLRDNNLKDGGVKFICSTLIHPNCKIQKLCLSDNGLTDSSCSQLASAISSNRSLRSLDLSYNNQEGPHFNDLMRALSSPTCRIEELILIRSNLTDSSCSHLASALSNSQSLRKLDLTDNRLEGPNFCDLMSALSNPTCRLEELIFNCNGRLIDSSSIQLASVLSKNQSLKTLSLIGSYLVGPLFSDLMTALSSPTCRIEELILRDNSLTDDSCYQLAMAIHRNQSLRRLDLSFNNLSGPRFSDLIKALSSPTCRIEVLMLEKIEVTDKYAPLLASLSNSNLTHLNLNRNTISDHIREQILRSPSMKELKISYRTFSRKEVGPEHIGRWMWNGVLHLG